jgi:hypothetical protein
MVQVLANNVSQIPSLACSVGHLLQCELPLRPVQFQRVAVAEMLAVVDVASLFRQLQHLILLQACQLRILIRLSLRTRALNKLVMS